MIKLTHTAKLPFDVIKGSYEKRLEFAKFLNANLYSRITSEFKTKDVSPDIFYNHLKEVSKNKINFCIKDSTNEPFRGANYLVQNPDNMLEADRFSIFLPLNRFDKTISLNDTDVFMHEFFHFFCGIVNPKHNKRALKMYEKNLLGVTENFYSKNLYTKKNFEVGELKEALSKFLEILTDFDKIDFLQNSRYRLKEEMHAYKEGAKYYDKIQDEHMNLIYEKFECENGDSYNFQEKINILETSLLTILNKVRNCFK